MSPTRRGRNAAAMFIVLLLVGGAVLGFLILGARNGVGPLASGNEGPGGTGEHPVAASPPPTDCPLTGINRPGTVPNRPALAVKVENVAAARPQTGLSWADIVYEEPVEAGITRFIAVYQCQDASRIEPVRSGRLTDPDILVQFGHPIFGYAGAVPQVYAKSAAAGLIDVNFTKAAAMKSYHRDPARLAPHNLYTSTHELYTVAHTGELAPKPVFTYSKDAPAGTRVAQVHLPFSSYSDVYWKWDGSKNRWMRFHGSVPHTLSDGTQVSATNVVVQVVRVVQTDITDVNGVHSPEVVSTGSGKAYVFRNGKVIAGTWHRGSLSEITSFVDSHGDEIPLAQGNTWVELVPQGIPITYA